jgi:hypothetical protein
MTVGKFFGNTARKLAVGAAILAAIGLATVPRPADAGGGWGGVGSAPVPQSGSVSELSLLAPCSRTLTTTTLIITRMVTTAITHPPQLTIHRRRITRLHGAVGAPIIITITLVE